MCATEISRTYDVTERTRRVLYAHIYVFAWEMDRKKTTVCGVARPTVSICSERVLRRRRRRRYGDVHTGKQNGRVTQCRRIPYKKNNTHGRRAIHRALSPGVMGNKRRVMLNLPPASTPTYLRASTTRSTGARDATARGGKRQTEYFPTACAFSYLLGMIRCAVLGKSKRVN